MSLRLTETVTMPGKPALLSKQELRQGFDASHPQMAGGANVESLLPPALDVPRGNANTTVLSLCRNLPAEGGR